VAIGGLGSISHLRDVGVELESGAFAIYGLRSASLWVATTRDSASAQKAVQLLMLRIEKGDTPFRTNEAVSIEGREVRELSGLGQRHFVFTAGRRLVWLAANRDHADSSLSQVLRFYR
jgi:hypothetical protein